MQENCQAVATSCRQETLSSETGTTYTWPETTVGEVATFRCPLNNRVSISRRCNEGGVWQMFNESACGVVNAQLNRLNNTFNNVSGQ